MSAISVYRMNVVTSMWWPLMSGAAVTGQGLGESIVQLAGGFIIASAGYARYYLVVAALVALGGALFLVGDVSHDPGN
jgi:hypothetical protein